MKRISLPEAKHYHLASLRANPSWGRWPLCEHLAQSWSRCRPIGLLMWNVQQVIIRFTLVPVTATLSFLLNATAPVTSSLTKHWYVPLWIARRYLPVKVPSSLRSKCKLSVIAVPLCFQVHVKLDPVALQGSVKLGSDLNFTSSGLTKSSFGKFVITGGLPWAKTQRTFYAFKLARFSLQMRFSRKLWCLFTKSKRLLKENKSPRELSFP